MARAVRVDSTVIEADVRYPSDAMLALQGARALAREGRKLARRLRRPSTRVVDRSRQIGKTVRADLPARSRAGAVSAARR